MSKFWKGKSGTPPLSKNDARVTVRGDMVDIMTQWSDTKDFSVISFEKKEALSLATWILDNVKEVEE